MGPRDMHDYPVPTAYNRLHVTTLASRLRTKSDRYNQAVFLKQLARNSIGKSNSSQSFLIRSCISDLIRYDKQLKFLKKTIKTKLQLFPKITSVPGIGPINGATILGETGDINRFSNKYSYFAYYGLDPIVYESGKYKLKKSKISKRGSRFLRTAAFSASRVACVGQGKDTNKFREKYDRMKKSGKHHNKIICAVSKNLVHSVYQILKDNVFYDNSK